MPLVVWGIGAVAALFGGAWLLKEANDVADNVQQSGSTIKTSLNSFLVIGCILYVVQLFGSGNNYRRRSRY